MSAAGDINGDGMTDLIIGACYPWRLRVAVMWYLVGPEWAVAGTVALSSLNGANGFKLDGEDK